MERIFKSRQIPAAAARSLLFPAPFRRFPLSRLGLAGRGPFLGYVPAQGLDHLGLSSEGRSCPPPLAPRIWGRGAGPPGTWQSAGYAATAAKVGGEKGESWPRLQLGCALLSSQASKVCFAGTLCSEARDKAGPNQTPPAPIPIITDKGHLIFY